MPSAPPAAGGDAAHPERWHFRLQLLTAIAVLVLLVIALRARSARAEVERRRDAVQATLRALVSVQEEHYARTGRYAVALDSAILWRPPAEVTLRLVAEDDQNWRAVATDSALTVAPRSCGVYMGRQSAAPHRAVIEPGVVACW
jgi:Tfp pilus assembly protein PilE